MTYAESFRKIHAALFPVTRALCAECEHAPMIFAFEPGDKPVARVAASVPFKDESGKDLAALMLTQLAREFGIAVMITEAWAATPTKWETEGGGFRQITPASERPDRREVLLFVFQARYGLNAVAKHPIHAGPPRTVDDAELCVQGERGFSMEGRFAA